MLNYIFSWAENSKGDMVHVDDVPNGLHCGCVCPHCKEQLLARHGTIKEHGFAHHSKTRKATLKICYEISLYKLAEQILLTKKRIHTPSYYGIYKEKELEFVEVKIDNHYEREDKQPDVIAKTKDGKEYLIEFILSSKVQHKQAIDYKNMNCLEVDLSNQTLESLETFILSSNEDKRWLNNEEFFNTIEKTYLEHEKKVKIMEESTCDKCMIRHKCCAVKKNNTLLFIHNNGQKYRLCKTESYEKELKEFEQSYEFDSHRPFIKEGPLSCFDCRYNYKCKNSNNIEANCLLYYSLGLPCELIDARYANTCPKFQKEG